MCAVQVCRTYELSLSTHPSGSALSRPEADHTYAHTAHSHTHSFSLRSIPSAPALTLKLSCSTWSHTSRVAQCSLLSASLSACCSHSSPLHSSGHTSSVRSLWPAQHARAPTRVRLSERAAQRTQSASFCSAAALPPAACRLLLPAESQYLLSPAGLSRASLELPRCLLTLAADASEYGR